MFSSILLVWAILLLAFVLALMRGRAHWDEPKPGPSSVDDTIER